MRRWHSDIDEGDVRLEVPDSDEKGVGVADFGDDLYAVVREQTRDALTNQRRPDAWLAFGFADDLDEAAIAALASMLDLMERELSIGRKEALALASIAVDLRITQLVNAALGVHAALPLALAAGEPPAVAAR